MQSRGIKLLLIVTTQKHRERYAPGLPTGYQFAPRILLSTDFHYRLRDVICDRLQSLTYALNQRNVFFLFLLAAESAHQMYLIVGTRIKFLAAIEPRFCAI